MPVWPTVLATSDPGAPVLPDLVQSPAPSPSGPTALTWQELRLAAEAGFDQLLQEQEYQKERSEVAALGGWGDTSRNKSPYRSPLARQRALEAAGEEGKRMCSVCFCNSA